MKLPLTTEFFYRIYHKTVTRYLLYYFKINEQLSLLIYC